MDNCSNSETSSPVIQYSSHDKMQTHFAKIIVGGTTQKPYYEIMYYDPSDHTYHIGYGSYCLDYVVRWLADEFDVHEELQREVVLSLDADNLKRIIARHVRSRMFDQNINCKELAQRIGKHENTILRIANGINIPRADTLLAIADALNCSTDWLLGRTYL